MPHTGAAVAAVVLAGLEQAHLVVLAVRTEAAGALRSAAREPKCPARVRLD
jgi:hypothetical protein